MDFKMRKNDLSELVSKVSYKHIYTFEDIQIEMEQAKWQPFYKIAWLFPRNKNANTFPNLLNELRLNTYTLQYLPELT